MNDMAERMVVEDHKHYVLTIDPETGEEIKVEVCGIDEFSQEVEGDETTVDGVNLTHTLH